MQDSVFVTSGDIPLLNEKIIKQIVDNYDSKNVWTSIMITQTFLNSLGIKSEYKSENEKYVFSGISLVNAEGINDLKSIKETFLVIDAKRIGFNLNTEDDYELLCRT